MNRKFFGKLIILVSLVVACVLWLLSVIDKETFGFFSLAWAIVLVSSASGIVFVATGLLSKDNLLIKKTKVFFGLGLFVVAFFALITEIVIEKNTIAPILALIFTLALLLSYLAVGGKKWDQGDNRKVGYENYYDRKKREEKEKNK